MFGKRCCFNNNMNNKMMCDKIVEPTITKCIEEEYYHEVPHICPIHTHVIKRYIYNHTYTPEYSCSTENQVINNDCGGCSNFTN